jgi:hypothetical protein
MLRSPIEDYFMNCKLEASMFGLRRLGNDHLDEEEENDVWFEVSSVSKPSGERDPFDPRLLKIFFIEYETSEKSISLRCDELRDLSRSQKNLVPSEYGFKFKLNNIRRLQEDIMINVKVLQCHVKGSPQVSLCY